MTVLSVGQIQGFFPLNEIIVDPRTKLTIEGPLRVSTIQNIAGFTTLTSTSSGVLSIAGNLTTTSRLNSNIVSPSRIVIPIWTTPTRPVGSVPGSIGYNTTITSLEFFTGSQWNTITGTFTAV
jgi:hypothetical protein